MDAQENVPLEVRQAESKEAQRRKISEGMRRSHERRRQLREAKRAEPRTKPVQQDALLARLIKERDALNVVIESLQQRGVT